MIYSIVLTAALASATLARERSPVDPKLFDLFVRYTNLTAASINQPCISPPSAAAVVGYINITQSDTQATIFRSDDIKEFVLAIPGTSSDRDLITDFQIFQAPLVTVGSKGCAGCAVHTGFLGAWNSISPNVIEILNASLEAYPSYQVIVTGHSLGAGIASIATVALTGLGFPVKATYTFGQPRSGNQAFANHIDRISGASETAPGNFYRVTHADDLIPQILPRLLGYAHSSTEYWETDSASGTQTAELTYRCYGQEPADCNQRAATLSGYITAHSRYSNVQFPNNASCGV